MIVHKYTVTFGGCYSEFLSPEARATYIVENNLTEYTTSDFDEDIVEPTTDPMIYISEVVQAAMNFGHDLTLTFCAENVLRGITQAGMTDKVRTVLDSAFRALETGSLYEAIDKIKAVKDEDKDPIFITNARLIKYLNYIESYLNIPLTVGL